MSDGDGAIQVRDWAAFKQDTTKMRNAASALRDAANGHARDLKASFHREASSFTRDSSVAPCYVPLQAAHDQMWDRIAGDCGTTAAALEHFADLLDSWWAAQKANDESHAHQINGVNGAE